MACGPGGANPGAAARRNTSKKRPSTQGPPRSGSEHGFFKGPKLRSGRKWPAGFRPCHLLKVGAG